MDPFIFDESSIAQIQMTCVNHINLCTIFLIVLDFLEILESAYPLVMTDIATANCHRNSEFSHYINMVDLSSSLCKRLPEAMVSDIYKDITWYNYGFTMFHRFS